MVCMSAIGTETGQSPIFPLDVILMTPSINATSVEVPPMSRLRMRSHPAC